MCPSHSKNLRLSREDLRIKNKIRTKFKRERLSSITPAQLTLFNALVLLGKEYQFKVVKEREIYTKEGVRFADLFIKKYGLAIEVDGGYHLTPEQKIKDLQRDEEIWNKKKIITLRVGNKDVWTKVDDVLGIVKSIALRLSDLPNYKSPGKGIKKLHNTLARKKIYDELRQKSDTP